MWAHRTGSDIELQISKKIGPPWHPSLDTWALIDASGFQLLRREKTTSFVCVSVCVGRLLAIRRGSLQEDMMGSQSLN